MANPKGQVAVMVAPVAPVRETVPVDVPVIDDGEQLTAVQLVGVADQALRPVPTPVPAQLYVTEPCTPTAKPRAHVTVTDAPGDPLREKVPDSVLLMDEVGQATTVQLVGIADQALRPVPAPVPAQLYVTEPDPLAAKPLAHTTGTDAPGDPLREKVPDAVLLIDEVGQATTEQLVGVCDQALRPVPTPVPAQL